MHKISGETLGVWQAFSNYQLLLSSGESLSFIICSITLRWIKKFFNSAMHPV